MITHLLKEINMILTKKEFSRIVEEHVHRDNLSYLDAILYICEQRGIDPADIRPLLSNIIKEKLEVECIKLRLVNIPITNCLPI